MTNRRNFYRILHVQRDAPTQVIRASYRTLMQRLRMHPDLGGDDESAALINEAFATLIDPDRRAAYDRARLRPIEERAQRRTAPALAEPARSATGTCPFCGTLHAGRDSTRPGAACVSCGSPLCAPVRLSPEIDRRAVHRRPYRMRVTYCLSWPADELFRGATEDVSISGMRLLAPFAIATGSRLRLDCDFCAAVGVVRSCRTRPTGETTPPLWTVGVEFLTISVKRPRGTFVSADV